LAIKLDAKNNAVKLSKKQQYFFAKKSLRFLMSFLKKPKVSIISALSEKYLGFLSQKFVEKIFKFFVEKVA